MTSEATLYVHHLPAGAPELLDNPALWSAYGTHARLVRRAGGAAAFDPQVSPFTAIPQPPTPEDWADLAELVGPGGTAVVSGDLLEPPGGWVVNDRIPGVQLVAETLVTAPDPGAVRLGPQDVPEMLDLVARAEPGPFLPRTIELGTYLGIRIDGRLVAMAGERLRPPGWTEISAVCTDEAFRGRGLATRLIRAVADGIERRGDRPMLHTGAGNERAIALYEHLGFRLRRRLQFQSFQAPSTGVHDAASR
ncbi:GNAT family N-acetyltransferase [Flexivirga oryzae]|uniref:Ribosomal protein S18 acetylase RimI-like enzyme n=1 Tax=Flexivirga oryzae TaxID=1794944 RepID=A0A839N3C0_9MICO|nr:GNAT family N-acetyltransferase [Flexivirga oryzae]MBB2892238.1 ribosomal protein S18 acetylase RimI-like enzyme [Flexivirga oryzae]